MPIRRIFIANRGEAAIRVARAASDLDLASVAACAADDQDGPHARWADVCVPLPGRGTPAYLDSDALIGAALSASCDAIHPGYGFLSENAAFARQCIAQGLAFIGPNPEALAIFADKAQARRFAQSLGVPVLPGSSGPADLPTLRRALADLPAGGRLILKAVAGGGGRGMRVIAKPADLEAAYESCRNEALAAFGEGALYGELFLPRARHVEVQIVSDGQDWIALPERECSLQRRRQKVIEITPCPGLDPALRARLFEYALTLTRAAQCHSLCTVEFLIDADDPAQIYFMEANPRLQVEHTITEELLGVDLVQAQIQIAAGRSLAAAGLGGCANAAVRGFAVQARVNFDRMTEDGGFLPTTGTLTRYEPPSGPGVRVDGCGFPGLRVNSSFDPLLAKVIVRAHAENVLSAASKLRRALERFHVEGADTNLPFLRALLAHPGIAAPHTQFVEENAAALYAAAHHDAHAPSNVANDDAIVASPIQGRLLHYTLKDGDFVRAGQCIAILEAMKMEHEVKARTSGRVRLGLHPPGAFVAEGTHLAFIETGAGDEGDRPDTPSAMTTRTAPAGLAELEALMQARLDANRAQAVEKRKARGKSTIRDLLGRLFDAAHYSEIGALVVETPRPRSHLEHMRSAPGDGVIAAIGAADGAPVTALAYDCTVYAGTQGAAGHKKTDRALEIAAQRGAPMVVFAAGGGGRLAEAPESHGASFLDCDTFTRFAALAESTPTIGVVTDYCFAGNAALLTCCDVVIATEDANIGMGGPAMVESAGLGAPRAADIGPVSTQRANGTVDIAVSADEAAVEAARTCLAYAQGATSLWSAADQTPLRTAIPPQRARAFDIRAVTQTLFDEGSVLELKRDFGRSMMTAFARLEGRPIGLIANDCAFLAGAIDRDGADKASDMMALCARWNLPLVSLIDTPGFMVGADAERAGQARAAGRLFRVGASLQIPIAALVLRRAYGLGAMAMCGGSLHTPRMTMAWPSGEFAGAAIEGAVRVAHRDHLARIEDPRAREDAFRTITSALYARGRAVNVAAHSEIDAVIDPAETRPWLAAALAPNASPRRRI